MLGFFEYALILLATVMVGVYWLSNTILPLCYSLPKGLFWCSRGAFRWRLLVISATAPLIWIAATWLLGFVLAWYGGRQLVEKIIEHPGFVHGEWVAVALFFGSLLFSDRARLDVRYDFFWLSLRHARLNVAFHSFIQHHRDVVANCLTELAILADGAGGLARTARHVMAARESQATKATSVSAGK